MNFIALILVFLGTVLMGIALVPARHLCTGRPQNIKAWRFLGALVILFLLGYAAYFLYLLQAEIGRLDLLISLILFGGAIFVLTVVFLAQDSIAQLSRMAEAERYRSLHDELTELPNRNYVHEQIDQAVSHARHNGEQFSVLLIDLNHFKEFNNVLGHFYGDFLLQKVANRLQNNMWPDAILARWGGDKFAVLSPATSGQEATALANQIVSCMAKPFKIEGHSLSVNISIGIVTYPEHGTETEMLMQHADIAMYEALRNNLDYTVFDPAGNRTTWNRLLMAGELRQAIANREMSLVFQPQVSVLNGRLSGVEALLRWNHQEKGEILPNEFVEVAEQSGQINALSVLVLDQAMRQLSLWNEHGLNIDLAINLSIKNLHDYEFPVVAERLLHKWRIDPSRIILEITESSIMVDPGRVASVISALKEIGFQLAIDDFGTGYSSLAYLRKFPARLIKIDKSFVMDMLESEDSAMIVKSTIDMAHNIGRQVVAEGVRNHATQVLLKRLGCDFLQGFHISRPLNAADFEEWHRQYAGKGGVPLSE